MLGQWRLGVCVLAMAAATAGSALAIVRHHVNQSALQFSVSSLQVQRGDTIVFSNSDRSSHNITIRGGEMNFNGGLQRPGQNLEVPFTASGRYNVVCGIHPRMRMDVEVR